MKHLYFLTILLFFSSNIALNAQEEFYNTESIQEIRIYFEQDNWDELLDALYVAGEKERLLANLVINGEAIDSVGIRYKGFSSVSTDRKKNPFNIKLDYVIDNQKYDGIDKIKLSNVIQDPSFVRETLSYDIARKYMPASRANYARVYINDEYWGLYTNVEAVNKDFIEQYYNSRNNAFFKCNPAELDFDGENSNLGNSHGTDTTAYYPYYDIESDNGWTELYELIDVLNENPENIESVLNVDRTLWMHAFNYVLVNFDSYIGYAQNYYLYKDDNGQFNPILWDLNQSFASYRLTDASENFDGFSIAQAKIIDPLLHHTSVSISPRPLMRNLFANDTYRRMFMAHLRTIIEENFANQTYATRAQTFQNLIETAVLEDENKFYSNEGFTNNLQSTVSDLVDYPGITDLMDGRTTYLQNYEGYQGAPEITEWGYSPENAAIGGEIWITATTSNAENMTLAYRFGGNGLFQKVAMSDDGTQNDGAANDGVFGVQLSNIGSTVEYYFYAENETAGMFSPQRAAYEYHSLQAQIETSEGLVINEFLASNDAVMADEAGEYDDWIELYNTSNTEISTLGLYLSDNENNLQKWALPETTIPSNDYLIIWADEDGSQGDFHANFKLSSGGETLTLSTESGEILDVVAFGEQTTDISYGRFPNGTGSFGGMSPTFGAQNSTIVGIEDWREMGISLFPNPTQSMIYLQFDNEIPLQYQLFSPNGQLVKSESIVVRNSTLEVSVGNVLEGLYVLQLVFEDAILTEKIIIQK